MQLIHVLGAIRRGAVVREADVQLAELVRAVDATGKKGKLVIELTVKPMSREGAEKAIEAKVDVKVPRRDLPSATFFSDGEGTLHRADPGEQDMFIEINPATGEIVEREKKEKDVG